MCAREREGRRERKGRGRERKGRGREREREREKERDEMRAWISFHTALTVADIHFYTTHIVYTYT